ncbi:hypothetical protein CISG_05172 [Coccidioides immitis RMSCC 3703]|uniref:Uncharacterized protein n=2 Tax=Coccidioides immitis TaxID=5501 RepID=A0A0J8QUM4_COCIT|nr:hypothetical protein CIRG_00142 [Coccidioides immitis RMSCC 2394]KMU75775.1 hypothetical protein CISG_05172 [Coccidioides immitis RMSCC 3703]
MFGISLLMGFKEPMCGVFCICHLLSTMSYIIIVVRSPPRAPFGSTTASQCVLRVTTHLQCPRHHLEYAYWNWILEDGSVIEDQGFDSTSRYRFSEESSMVINMSDTLFPEKSPT